MSPVLRIGLSPSNTGTKAWVFSWRMAAHRWRTIRFMLRVKVFAPAGVLPDAGRDRQPIEARKASTRGTSCAMSTSRPPVHVGPSGRRRRARPKTIVCIRKRRARSSRSISDAADVGLPLHHRGELGERRRLRGVQPQHRHTLPVEREPGDPRVFHANHVRPGDLELRFSGSASIRDLGVGAAGRASPRRQEGDGNAEDVDVLGREDRSRGPARTQCAADRAPPPARRGAGWRMPQPHDVRHRARVPALGEHGHRDDVLDVLAGFPGWPTVSTCTRSRSACSCLVSLRAGRSSASSPSSSSAALPSTGSASSRASACAPSSRWVRRSGTASSSMRTLPGRRRGERAPRSRCGWPR